MDLKTGARLWEVPLGTPARLLPPEQAAKIPAEWGSPSLGGPIVTAGGVVFIGGAWGAGDYVVAFTLTKP
jgi:quinoprotein glucose dehydrogenase